MSLIRSVRRQLKRILKKSPTALSAAKSTVSYCRKVMVGTNAIGDEFGPVHYNDLRGSKAHYTSVGASAIDSIMASLKAAGRSPEDIHSVLDYACGYGRVLRQMVKKFPQAKFVAADTIVEAVNFCHKTFGATPVALNENFDFPGKYDLIWVGSLFTHLTEESFDKTLKRLISSLNVGGVLVFTTHGESCIENAAAYDAETDSPEVIARQVSQSGFYFCQYPGNNSEYGICFATRDFVKQKIESNGAKFMLWQDRGWDRHQDVFAVSAH